MHRFTLSNLARLIQQLLVGTLLCMSVAACAGGNPTVAMTQGATPSFVRSTMQTGNAAIADEHNGCSSYNGERLYTDNPSGQAQQAIVFAFKANAHGSTLPLCTISYGGLSRPGGMVDDASGKLWVMDSEDISLMVFPHTANGSSPPAQAISGSNTLLVGSEAAGYQGIAVDQAGNVWVPCWYDYNNPYGYLVAFANNANGNVAPVATIGFGDKGVGEHIASPLAVTFDHEGNLYVAEFNPVVVVFTPPFRDTSRPVATWNLPHQDTAQYLSVDSHDNVYVGGQGSIDIFKGGLKSKGVLWRHIPTPRANGFYDVKVDNENHIDAAMVAGYNGINAVGVLRPHASSFDNARYITSPPMRSPPGTLALGL